MNTRTFLFTLVSSVVGRSGLASLSDSFIADENAPSFDAHLLEPLETQTSGIVRIGTCAQVDLPQGFDYVSGESFQRWLRPMDWGDCLVPCKGRMRHPQSGWYAHFEYCDEGHLLDDEKNQLDADAILEVLREQERKVAPLRRHCDIAQRNILGFELTPRYDERAHLLEWATRYITAGEAEECVYHEALILGRRGVVELQLSCAPGELHHQLSAFRTLLEQFRFEEGESYSDYEPTDKAAPYGLIQAITGPHKRGLPDSIKG